MEYFKLVEEFQLTFDGPVLQEPQVPDDRWQLRIGLIEEELEELNLACADNDLMEVLDALCDLQYVLTGAILEFGFQHCFNSAFEAVHKSNMSKACVSMEEVELTINKYREEGIKASYKKLAEDRYLIYRLSDNKTLKSINYKPVNLKPFIDGTQQEKSL